MTRSSVKRPKATGMNATSGAGRASAAQAEAGLDAEQQHHQEKAAKSSKPRGKATEAANDSSNEGEKMCSTNKQSNKQRSLKSQSKGQ